MIKLALIVVSVLLLAALVFIWYIMRQAKKAVKVIDGVIGGVVHSYFNR